MFIFSVVVQDFFRESVDYIASTFSIFSNKTRRDDKKSLLIIRLDAIGDFVIFLDTFKEYRKLYPPDEWEITLMGNGVWSDLATCLPYADEYLFIDVDKFISNMFYRLGLLLDVSRRSYNVIIEPTFSRRYFLEDTFVRICSAEKKIGSIGDLSNISGRRKRRSDKWYTDLIPATNGIELELERNAEFFRGLGLKSFRASSPTLPMDLFPEPVLKKTETKKPYFLVSPGASWQPKRWKEKGFAMVARKVYKKTGWPPLLCAGPGDEALAKRVITFAPELPWINMAGMTSLIDLIWLINNSELVISNDSAAVHIASSLTRPVVCIIGGGHFGRFFPYGDLEQNRIVYNKMDCFNCDWQCIYSSVRCLEEITVDNVWKEVSPLLNMKTDTEVQE